MTLFVAVLVFPSETEREPDRDALIALYNATDGDNWSVNWNWLGDTTIRRWVGVLSVGGGRVGELRLGDNELRGSIPAELGALVRLTHLDLSHNELRGSIPAELGALVRLTHLDLSHNELGGPIPPELGKLTNLRTLYLSGNDFSGCIPEGLRGVSDHDLDRQSLPFCAAEEREVLVAVYHALNGENWKRSANWLDADKHRREWQGVTTDINGRVIALDLWENRLTGPIPAELGALSQLTTLRLDGNELSGPIPPELGGLTDLLELCLSDNQLTGPIPPELGGLTNLRKLCLSENQLTGAIPTELANLRRLTSLSVSGNGFSGCIPGGLRGVPGGDLEQLGLPFCN